MKASMSRRAVLAGGSTIALAATAAIPTALANEDPDGGLLAAEREIARLYAVLADMRCETQEDEDRRMPIYDAICELEDTIATTPAAGLVGAAVKLRRLCDPVVGLEAGKTDTDCLALVDVLAVVEREIGGRARS